jgi:hypothetical protein
MVYHVCGGVLDFDIIQKLAQRRGETPKQHEERK